MDNERPQNGRNAAAWVVLALLLLLPFWWWVFSNIFSTLIGY